MKEEVLDVHYHSIYLCDDRNDLPAGRKLSWAKEYKFFKWLEKLNNHYSKC